MQKAREIIARFTSDPRLTEKILDHVAAARAGKPKSIEQIVTEHCTDPASAPRITRKVHEVIAKIKRGHPIHSVAAYHAPDQNVAHKASEMAMQHVGAIKHILYPGKQAY